NPIATRSPDHLLAGARAYNRWGAELCNDSPERRVGLIVAPIVDDIDGAVAEVRRAHADGLSGGVIIPPRWGDKPSYPSRVYDAVWAACQELSLPVHCHSGPAPHEDYGTAPGWMSVYGFETIFFTARPLWFMLMTGVFERFPRLKMAVTEAGCYWAADLLWRAGMMGGRGRRGGEPAHAPGGRTPPPREDAPRTIKIGGPHTPPRRRRRRCAGRVRR